MRSRANPLHHSARDSWQTSENAKVENATFMAIRQNTSVFLTLRKFKPARATMAFQVLLEAIRISTEPGDQGRGLGTPPAFPPPLLTMATTTSADQQQHSDANPPEARMPRLTIPEPPPPITKYVSFAHVPPLRPQCPSPRRSVTPTSEMDRAIRNNAPSTRRRATTPVLPSSDAMMRARTLPRPITAPGHARKRPGSTWEAGHAQFPSTSRQSQERTPERPRPASAVFDEIHEFHSLLT